MGNLAMAIWYLIERACLPQRDSIDPAIVTFTEIPVRNPG
jgi:hypothetical protein